MRLKSEQKTKIRCNLEASKSVQMKIFTWIIFLYIKKISLWYVLSFLGNLKISKIHLEILFPSAFQTAWAGGRVDTLMSTWQLKYTSPSLCGFLVPMFTLKSNGQWPKERQRASAKNTSAKGNVHLKIWSLLTSSTSCSIRRVLSRD